MPTSTQKMATLHLPQSNGERMTITDFGIILDLKKLIQPETKLEQLLLDLPEFQEGLNWGKPRFGHPEGKVGLHVREVLDNIDKLKIDAATRLNLRFLAIVHDTFKYQEVKTLARGKRIHHGKIARDFVAEFIEHENLLEILELHDEAFYIWRQLELRSDLNGAMSRLSKLLTRLAGNLPMYFLFFKCDTETGDKILAPLRWFENTVKELANEEDRKYLENCY